MLVRQLFDPVSSTYTYLVTCPATADAVLIDPVFEHHARDAALIRELGVQLVATLDTHCHADHVTGAWRMQQAFGSRIGLAAVYGADGVDLPLNDGDIVGFGACALHVRATPGHTDGCLSFVAPDATCVFTGDALLVRGTGRTDFQQGNAHRLFQSIHRQLFSLPDACVVYPAHDYEGRTSSTIGEEKRFNVRIGGGAREEDFVGTMLHLALPHPRLLAVAVPANLRVGRPEDGDQPTTATWAPVTMSYAGLPEIGPDWVSEHLDAVHVLDVRTDAELRGDLGQVPGALHLPLDALRDRLGDVPRDRPVVVVCQTGRRSALATNILRKAGLTEVANLAGGMVAWHAAGAPVAVVGRSEA